MGGEGGAGGVNAHLTAFSAILERLALFLIDLSSFRFGWLFGAFGAVVGIYSNFVQILCIFFEFFVAIYAILWYSILAGGR